MPPTHEKSDKSVDFFARILYNKKGVDQSKSGTKISAAKERTMELIQSFSVDHTRIIPGIFTSRIDKLGDRTVTTYDVRLKKPNRPAV